VTMRAVEVSETGGPEVLKCVDKTRPTPGPDQLFDAIASGAVNVNVNAHYPLKDAAQAHRDFESRRTVGSVVLTP
jgi:NADPH:quinone reductase-like Zn-dependent oxidoreductase